ncbi:hypothetical protein S245_004824, partial [Arachis hypogaea]
MESPISLSILTNWYFFISFSTLNFNKLINFFRIGLISKVGGAVQNWLCVAVHWTLSLVSMKRRLVKICFITEKKTREEKTEEEDTSRDVACRGATSHVGPTSKDPNFFLNEDA